MRSVSGLEKRKSNPLKHWLCYQKASGLRFNGMKAIAPLVKPRMHMKRTIAALTALSILTGCAATPSDFYTNRYSISDEKLCRGMQSDAAKTDPTFSSDLHAEASRRGISTSDCETIVGKQNLAIGAGVLLGAAVIALARKGGGGGSAQAGDYQWDWDQFYNQSGQLVWNCRGVQTGRFADNSRCAGKLMVDTRWPSK
jgi:hypothetical protein